LGGLLCLNADALQGLSLAESRIAIQTAESLDAIVSILVEASLLDWAGTTMTACRNSLSFRAAWAYRESESYRILSEGFVLWMLLARV